MSAVGKWVAGILGAVITAVLVAVIVPLVTGPAGGPSPSPNRPARGDGSVAIYLNKDSGAAGTTVRVSGQGFAPDEEITLRFHTETVGHTGADGQGRFEAVSVDVPDDWPFTGQFAFVATGESSVRSAQREFRVT